LVQRSEDLAVDPAPVPAPALAEPERRGWLGRLFDRLEASAWEREARARDAYLAEATSHADLEQRIREYDRASARRGYDGFPRH
jgi:hypothetical protein